MTSDTLELQETTTMPKDFEELRRLKDGVKTAAKEEEAEAMPLASLAPIRKADFLALFIDEDNFSAVPYHRIDAIQGTNLTREEQAIFITTGATVYAVHGKNMHFLIHRLLDSRVKFIRAGKNGVTKVEWVKTPTEQEENVT